MQATQTLHARDEKPSLAFHMVTGRRTMAGLVVKLEGSNCVSLAWED